jgi:hypothetical protein
LLQGGIIFFLTQKSLIVLLTTDISEF